MPGADTGIAVWVEAQALEQRGGAVSPVSGVLVLSLQQFQAAKSFTIAS